MDTPVAQDTEETWRRVEDRQRQSGEACHRISRHQHRIGKLRGLERGVGCRGDAHLGIQMEDAQFRHKVFGPRGVIQFAVAAQIERAASRPGAF